MPLSFNEWLGKKFKKGVDHEYLKPKEFEKALEGKQHHLTREEIIKIIPKYNLLTAEELQDELSFRLDCWILDISGRRDFQHAFNINLRKVLLKSDENWHKVSVKRRKEINDAITEKILLEKKEELLSSERTNSAISIDLFWQFEESLKKKVMIWTEWIKEHRVECKRNIELFKRKMSENTKKSINLTVKRKSVAGLNDVEQQLKEVFFFEFCLFCRFKIIMLRLQNH
jgi:hypothetical protein